MDVTSLLNLPSGLQRRYSEASSTPSATGDTTASSTAVPTPSPERILSQPESRCRSPVPLRNRTPWDAGGYSLPLLPLSIETKVIPSHSNRVAGLRTRSPSEDRIEKECPSDCVLSACAFSPSPNSPPAHKYSTSRSSLSSSYSSTTSTSDERSHSRISSLSTVDESLCEFSPHHQSHHSVTFFRSPKSYHHRSRFSDSFLPDPRYSIKLASADFSATMSPTDRKPSKMAGSDHSAPNSSLPSTSNSYSYAGHAFTTSNPPTIDYRQSEISPGQPTGSRAPRQIARAFDEHNSRPMTPAAALMIQHANTAAITPPQRDEFTFAIPSSVMATSQASSSKQVATAPQLSVATEPSATATDPDAESDENGNQQGPRLTASEVISIIQAEGVDSHGLDPQLLANTIPRQGDSVLDVLEYIQYQGPRVCHYKAVCEYANEPNLNWRKSMSHIFGRNKNCTRAVPEDVWLWFCRKHYQRARYRNGEYYLRLVRMIELQVLRIQAWSNDNVRNGRREDGVLVSWNIVPRKREMQREAEEETNEEHGDTDANADAAGVDGNADDVLNLTATNSTPLPDWLRNRCGENYTTAAVQDLISTIYDRMRHNEMGPMPDIEFLPNITGGKVRPQAKARAQAKGKSKTTTAAASTKRGRTNGSQAEQPVVKRQRRGNPLAMNSPVPDEEDEEEEELHEAMRQSRFEAQQQQRSAMMQAHQAPTSRAQVTVPLMHGLLQPSRQTAYSSAPSGGPLPMPTTTAPRTHQRSVSYADNIGYTRHGSGVFPPGPSQRAPSASEYVMDHTRRDSQPSYTYGPQQSSSSQFRSPGVQPEAPIDRLPMPIAKHGRHHSTPVPRDLAGLASAGPAAYAAPARMFPGAPPSYGGYYGMPAYTDPASNGSGNVGQAGNTAPSYGNGQGGWGNPNATENGPDNGTYYDNGYRSNYN